MKKLYIDLSQVSSADNGFEGSAPVRTRPDEPGKYLADAPVDGITDAIEELIALNEIDGNEEAIDNLAVDQILAHAGQEVEVVWDEKQPMPERVKKAKVTIIGDQRQKTAQEFKDAKKALLQALSNKSLGDLTLGPVDAFGKTTLTYKEKDFLIQISINIVS